MKVILVAALSVDGFIGVDPKQRAFDWTSKEDRRLFIDLSKEMGTIVMGSKTLETFRIKQAPPGRRLIILTSRPDQIVGEGIETSSESPQELVARLEKEGAKGLVVGGGSSVYRQYIMSGLVDELYLTIEPIVFGKGIPLFDEQLDVKLELLDQKMLNQDTTLLHYAVKK